MNVKSSYNQAAGPQTKRHLLGPNMVFDFRLMGPHDEEKLVRAMREGCSIEYDPPCPTWRWFITAATIRPQGKPLREMRTAAEHERARIRSELFSNEDALSRRVKFLERVNGLPVKLNRARRVADGHGW